MLKSEFHYELPEELIAQYPAEERGTSRLLYLNVETDEVIDYQFNDIVSLLNPEDILIVNDTRVIPARLYGRKETGGKVEILIERILGDKEILAQVRASKSPGAGSSIILDSDDSLAVIRREEEFFILGSGKSITEIIDKAGHIPLPPYIKRTDEPADAERYQTVYAKHPGAIAAPTAGLHFTEQMLNKIRNKGCEFGFVTLHVGSGTFQPVRVGNIEQHKMHHEYFEISQDLCDRIEVVKREGGRVIAVGTTTVRVLESAARRGGKLQAETGETDIFIYPGFDFHVVDALITNFHLPESTLLMLVCAFAGRESILDSYSHAIEKGYRFFSYGDAMFINRATSNKL